MATEFTSFSDLLELGHHKLIIFHFGLEEDFTSRMLFVSFKLRSHVDQLIRQVRETGNAKNTCECHLTKSVYAWLDEHIEPQNSRELVCAVHIASRLIEQAVLILKACVDEQTSIESIKKSLINYGPTGTA